MRQRGVPLMVVFVIVLGSACSGPEVASPVASPVASGSSEPATAQLSPEAEQHCGELIAAVDSEDVEGANVADAISGLMGLLRNDPPVDSADGKVMYDAGLAYQAGLEKNELDLRIAMNQLITDCLSPSAGLPGLPPPPTEVYSLTTQEKCVDLFRALNSDSYKAVPEAMGALTALGSDTVDPRVFAPAAAYAAYVASGSGSQAKFDSTFGRLFESCRSAVESGDLALPP